MNVILTSACNKACSFCFAKPYVTDPTTEVLTLEHAKQLVFNRLRSHHSISLLGGEPTCYPYFVELLQYIEDIQQPEDYTLLISNFLFTDSSIGHQISKQTQLGFLLNVAEMTEAQLSLFIRNLQYLTHTSFRPAITVTATSPLDYHVSILQRIYDYKAFKSLRVSIDNPIRGSLTFQNLKELFPEYGKRLTEVLSWAIAHNVEATFDCGTPYCLLAQDKNLLQLTKDASGTAVLDSWGCVIGAPTDIAPTGHTISCYPRNDISTTVSSFTDTVQIREVQREIAQKKLIQATKSLQLECLQCIHFPVTCRGPCLGCS